MSAYPQFSAKVNPDYVDGLALYKDQPVSIDFSKVVSLRQFKQEELSAEAVVVMTISSGPAGLAFPTAATGTYHGNGPYLSGTPTVNGDYSALIKAAVYRGTDNSNIPIGVLGACYIALPFIVRDAPTAGTAGAEAAADIPVISMPNAPYDSPYAASAETQAAFALQLTASGSPTSWAMIGAPSGITITNSGLVSGNAASPGVYLISVTATNAAGASLPRLIHLTVTDPPIPAYLEDGAVDLFFDLQTRVLSLMPPKPETLIDEGQTVLNEKDGGTLKLKSGETLWLNLRFVKGTRVIDPSATGIRLGVASRPGGPLVMEGTAFTKVGSGSATYHRIRVPISDAEFSSITGDYYDEDKVETPDVSFTTPTGDAQTNGFCEIELTTGSAETIAKIKSDTMPVTLSRSILT